MALLPFLSQIIKSFFFFFGGEIAHQLIVIPVTAIAFSPIRFQRVVQLLPRGALAAYH